MSRKLALLISNNHYADANLAQLAAPLADAAALARVLRDPASGAFDEVQTLVNQPSMRTLIRRSGFMSRVAGALKTTTSVITNTEPGRLLMIVCPTSRARATLKRSYKF